MDEMKEVFISYASKDREKVHAFVELLRSAGVSVWMDESGIDGAAYWSKEIVLAIKNAKAGILMVSASSMASDNVGREVHLLYKNNKKILPLYLENVEIPDELEYELARIQHLRLFQGEPRDLFWAILHALKNLDVRVKKELEPDNLFPGVERPPAQDPPVSGNETGSKRKEEKRKPGPVAILAGVGLMILILALFFIFLGDPENTSEPMGMAAAPTFSPATTETPPIPKPKPDTIASAEKPGTRTSSTSGNQLVSTKEPTHSQVTYAFSAPPILSTDGIDFRPHLLGAVQNAFPGVIPAPLEDSEFTEAFTGNVQSLSDKNFFGPMDALVLGRANLSFQKKSTLDPDLISCNLNFSMQAFGKSGEMMGSNSFRVVGVGFSNDDAARNAMEKLMDAYGASIFPARG
ncbi:MAG: toll/interleukin-1 receptor domain-containing protein [Desulfococcaceae bacterium]